MMMCLARSGLDSTINRTIYRALTPLWALGVHPRRLARVLVTIEIAVMAFSAVVTGPWSWLIYSPWAAAGAWVIIQTIPAWDSINDEVTSTGRLTMTAFLQLRIVVIARISLIGGVVGSSISGIPLAVAYGWPSLAWPIGTTLLLVGLNVVTILGDPPRSIQRRALDRVKQMARVPRLAYN